MSKPGMLLNILQYIGQPPLSPLPPTKNYVVQSGNSALTQETWCKARQEERLKSKPLPGMEAAPTLRKRHLFLTQPDAA